MHIVQGDIWEIALRLKGGCSIVIPTNCGWRADGRNVMGKGLARDAARRFPWLPAHYGEACRAEIAKQERMETRIPSQYLSITRPQGAIQPYYVPISQNKWCKSLVLLVVKPLNSEKPYLSWRAPACIDVIEYSLYRLQQVVQNLSQEWHEQYLGKQTLIPVVGCGNGELDPAEVAPIIERILVHPAFTLVML